MTARTPAARLVNAFGDVERMRALYDPDIEWSLPAGLPYPRPMKGIEAVVAFNTAVWSEHYFPDCTVHILDEVGDARLSAVRFIYRARFRSNGAAYENEYTLFARSSAGGIREVFEAMDTIAVLEQLNGQKVGETFARFVAGTGSS